MEETIGLFIFVAAVVVVALLLRRSRLLAIAPKVRCDGEQLIASTSLRGLLLSFTLLHRTVIVDPAKQVIEIHARILWFFRWSRTIPFDRIEKIIYRYEDMNPSTSFGDSGDSKDWFSVGLRLKGYDEVHLFHFLGEGSFQHGSLDWWPEWLYWGDRYLDMGGTQEQDSRSYVTQLKRILGVDLIN
jgi:hypothetical protein